MTIAIADDDPKVVEILQWYLEDAYHLVAVGDGADVGEIIVRENPALLILDVMLPGRDGVTILTEIRKRSRLPIILLTARSQENYIVEGLSLGADDYVTKPFSPREVKSRIESVLRRSQYHELERHVVGSLSLDRDAHEVSFRGRLLAITPKEFEILWILVVNRGQVFSRGHLLQTLADFENTDRSIDAHVKNLRKKLGLASGAIETVYGMGYRFNADEVI